MDNSLLKETVSLSHRNNMCRLCLSTNGVTEPIGYGDQFLLQKIYECTSIQITPLPGVSSSLCTICRARLEDFYQFRWQCIKNDEIIHRIAAVGSNKPLEPGEGRIQSDIANSVDCDKRLQEPASSYAIHHSRATGMVHHTEAKSHHHGVHSERMAANDAYSPFGTKYVDPAQASSPVTETPVNFRRKRGRPPKQQYDFGTHVISKGQTPMIGEQSQGLQRVPENRWNNAPVVTGNVSQMDQDTSGSSSENQEDQEWFKVKVEQIDQQAYPLGGDQLQHMHSMSHNSHQMNAGRAQANCAPTTQLNQVLASPTDSQIQPPLVQTGVKRSRGRPPREGGCPNEDRAEYRFRCQYCSARFKAAINLKLHTNTHTGEKPYLCTVCNKSFAHPSNLSVHMKLHSNQQAGVDGVYRSTLKDNGEKSGPSLQPEKKFQCPYCQTHFALAFQLKIHINTHTGQKPYVCKNCGKGFAQPSNLHVHSKKHCRRKQVQFSDTRTNEGQSSESYTHSVPENTVTMQTVESNTGGELSFGRSSSYQTQDSSLQPSHHLNNSMEESTRNNHPAMNTNHPMLV